MEKHKAREIIRALEDRGITLTEIAKELGISRQYVSMVVNGHRPKELVRKTIAAKLGWNPWSNGSGSAVQKAQP